MANLDELAHLAALADLEEAEILNAQPARQFHHRDDPFESLSDQKFMRTYRLTKGTTWDVIELLEPYTQEPSRKSALDLTIKVLTTLNFLAYGSYQLNIGQNINAAISQSSVSRAVTEITDLMNRPEIFNRFVYFPRNFQELREKRNEFSANHNFPGVIGCIDCTHIAIYPPHIYDVLYPEHMYVNRKGYHSINLQLICDARAKIINCLARYPGSTNDCFIWNNSNVLPFLQRLHNNGHKSYFLLGDSGYPLRSYLQIPLANRASKIINTCAILHNMCIDNNLPAVEPEQGDEDLDYGMIPHEPLVLPDNPIGPPRRINPDLVDGRLMQQAIIRNYFV